MTIFSPTRDRNEPDIIRALEAIGATVQRLHEPGVPDLLIGFEGKMFLLEVKGEVGKRGGTANRTLTETQERWWQRWTGPPPTIVRTVEEALAVLGISIVTPGMYKTEAGELKTYPRARKKKL